jgi:hypothetical protein
MKKLLTLLIGALIALSLFVTTGNTAKAAGLDCGCPGTSIVGAEKNKIVADLLSSQGFKEVNLDMITKGSTWNGASSIEVVDINGLVLVGVPFLSAEGVPSMYVFINNEFQMAIPL